MNPRRRLLLALPLACLAGCGDVDAEKPQPKTKIIFVPVPAAQTSAPQAALSAPQSTPAGMQGFDPFHHPLPPMGQPMGTVGQTTVGPMGQPTGQVSTAMNRAMGMIGTSTVSQQQLQQRAEEAQRKQEETILAKCLEIYSEYAHWVRLLEEGTTHINASKIVHRQRFYWLPLQKYNQELMSQNGISFEQLADIINTGQAQKWPTQSPKDGEYIARMLRRIPAERAIALRRMQASINLATLDAWCDSMMAWATTAGSRGGVSGRIGGSVSSGGIRAPVHSNGMPASFPPSFRFGPMSVH